MSTGLDNRPSATTYEVERLVNLAWSGQIRVPHFQRGFRWGRQDVIKLFDSIVKGYPVGSLLLWVRKAPAQRLGLGAFSLDAPAMEEALWVVDGQQRVTSLASALHEDGARDPRFALAYDLREQRFAPRTGYTEPHTVPLPVLFELPKLLKWFTDHPEAAEFQERAYDLTTVLRQHPVPAYLVKQERVEVLRDIFDRMNSYGKRLTRAEIFTGLHAGEESEQPSALTFEGIAAQVNDVSSFGRIDDDTVYSAVLARRGPDLQREIRIEFSDNDRRGTVDFPGEDKETAFRKGEEALLRAVEFVQKDAGVPHFTLLPYRYLLVVLARVFGHFPDPDPVNRRLLRRWFWRAALLGPEIFRGSTTGAIRQLCGKVRAGDLTESVQELLKAVDRPEPELPEVRRFRTNEATAKITLCSWWELEPRDPTTGAPFGTEHLAEALAEQNTVAEAVRYVFSPRAVPTEKRQWAANRLLIPATEHETGSALADVLLPRPLDAPEKLDEDVREQTLRSHLISPAAAELLSTGQAGAFLDERQRSVASHLKDFLQRMCEWGFENTPPIDDLVVPEPLPGGDDGPR